MCTCHSTCLNAAHNLSHQSRLKLVSSLAQLLNLLFGQEQQRAQRVSHKRESLSSVPRFGSCVFPALQRCSAHVLHLNQHCFLIRFLLQWKYSNIPVTRGFIYSFLSIIFLQLSCLKANVLIFKGYRFNLLHCCFSPFGASYIQFIYCFMG